MTNQVDKSDRRKANIHLTEIMIAAQEMMERVRMTVEQAVEQGMDRDNLMRCHGWNACLDAIEGDEK